MKIERPEYYKRFQCLCGKCPETCCENWIITIDDKTKASYDQLSGELGDKVRTHIAQEENGDYYMELLDGHCPMLLENGLCSMQCTYGEGALSTLCRQYPRYRYEFGAFALEGLSISCPEVCRLVCTGVTATETVQTAELPSPNDIDPALYLGYLQGRDTARQILGNSSVSFATRLRELLLFSEKLEDHIEAAKELCRDSTYIRDSTDSYFKSAAAHDFFVLKKEFEAMEYLFEEDRRQILGMSFQKFPQESEKLDSLAFYFLQKYFLQAAYDGLLLKKMQFMIACLMIISHYLMNNDMRSIWRFSREIEHSDNNLEAFYHWAGKRRQKLFLRLLNQ